VPGYVFSHLYTGSFLIVRKDWTLDATDRRLVTKRRSAVSVPSTRSCLTASVTRTQHHSLCVAAPANVLPNFCLWQIEQCVCTAHGQLRQILTRRSRSLWSRPRARRVPSALKRSGRRACRCSSNARFGNIFTDTMRAGPFAMMRVAGIVPV
jgi:hypothetical protein